MITTSQKQFEPLLDHAILTLVQRSFLHELRRCLELIGYCLFYRPVVFWWIFDLPQLFWRLMNNSIKALNEDFDINFPVHAVSERRAMVGHLGFRRLESEIKSAQAVAKDYAQSLSILSEVRLIKPTNGGTSNCPFVCVQFKNREIKQKFLAEVRALGLGVSELYAHAINDYPYLKSLLKNDDSKTARKIAGELVTLTTHFEFGEEELEKIVESVRRVSRENHLSSCSSA